MLVPRPSALTRYSVPAGTFMASPVPSPASFTATMPSGEAALRVTFPPTAFSASDRNLVFARSIVAEVPAPLITTLHAADLLTVRSTIVCREPQLKGLVLVGEEILM